MSEAKTLILSDFSDYNPDQILSCIVLANLLLKNSESASIYLGQAELLKNLSVPLAKVDQSILLTELTVQSNCLHLTNVPEIQNLNWNWQEGTLELELITTVEGKVNPQEVKLSNGSAGFNQVMFIGLNSVEKVKESLLPYTPDILNGAETVALLFEEPETQIAHQQHIYSEAKTYAQLIWQFAKEKGLHINGEPSTLLLTGIYSLTENLTNKFTTASIIKFVAELMEVGGKLDLVHSSDSPKEAETPKEDTKASEELEENQPIS